MLEKIEEKRDMEKLNLHLSLLEKCNYLSKGIAYAAYQIQAETELEINQVAVLYCR